MNALEVAGLKKNYAGFSLNVSFALEEGKITGFIGRNGAGKTTTIKSLLGFVHPDAGDIRFFSMPFAENEMKIKSRLGVVLGGVNYYPQKRLGTVAAVTSRFYPEWDDSLYRKYMQLFSLDESKRISELSAGMKVKFSLALALSHSADLLILDEPTSSLDEQEVEKLFKLMLDLKSRGVGIIFVTHFLEQVYAVCDRITVLRDGKLVGEYKIAELPRVQLVSKMLGKELDDLSEIKTEGAEDALENAEVVYEASGLSSAAGVRPFDFSIRKGEVNGFTGLLGSGRSESVRAIFGADHVSSGTVKMGGKLVKITSPLAAMKHGISYLPEDRKRDGIIGDLSVRDNIILARQVLDGFFHPISKAKAEKYAEEYIRLLSIKTASTDTPIKSLSGGNQQKVILARWLLANPVYMILDEPTRGIDVGTKVEIQKLVLQLAAEGKSVTFISSEIDEMLRVCSRLVVMRDRQVVGELRGSDLNQSSIMKTIAGGEQA